MSRFATKYEPICMCLKQTKSEKILIKNMDFETLLCLQCVCREAEYLSLSENYRFDFKTIAM